MKRHKLATTGRKEELCYRSYRHSDDQTFRNKWSQLLCQLRSQRASPGKTPNSEAHCRKAGCTGCYRDRGDTLSHRERTRCLDGGHTVKGRIIPILQKPFRKQEEEMMTHSLQD